MRFQNAISICLFFGIALFGQQGGNSTNNRVSDVARQSVYQSLGQATPPWASAGDCDIRNPDFYLCQAWVMTRDNRANNPALRSAPLSPPRSFSAISINVENASVSGGTAEVRLGVQAKCEFLSPTQLFGSLLECTPSQTLTTKVIVRLQAQDLLHNNWRVTSVSEDPQIVSQRQAQRQASQNAAARQQQEGQRFVQLAYAVCRNNDVAAARQALEQSVGDINRSLAVLKGLDYDPCPFEAVNLLAVAVINKKNVEMVALLAQHGADLETLVPDINFTRVTLLANLVTFQMYDHQEETIDPDVRRMVLTLLQNGANPAQALRAYNRETPTLLVITVEGGEGNERWARPM